MWHKVSKWNYPINRVPTVYSFMYYTCIPPSPKPTISARS